VLKIMKYSNKTKIISNINFGYLKKTSYNSFCII